ncbi:MAG: zf-HC2 domain-containing protein [Acidobacteria bacterium]|nr:zf-HC2 domain-containing protein [Acidobacteriota bacterium]
MRCRRVEGLLCDHQDGLLDAAERRDVEDHLAVCASCATLKDEMDLALDFLRQAPAVEFPADLVSSILDETVRTEPPAGGLVIAGVGPLGWVRPLLRPLFEPRLAMSLALALVSFSILTWSGQETFARWQRADPMAQVMTATVGFDQAWDRSVEVYRRVFDSATAPLAPAELIGAPDVVEDQADPAQIQ